MFGRLSESIKKTTAIAEGWKLGRLIFEKEDSGWVPYIEMGDDENDREYKMVDSYIVEVLNDSEWHAMTEEDYQRVTAEGWPLFGGFDCRFREREEGGRTLSKRELDLIIGALGREGKRIRDDKNYYQDDELQARYFELDVLRGKLEMRLEGGD